LRNRKFNILDEFILTPSLGINRRFRTLHAAASSLATHEHTASLPSLSQHY
jgi:hypothetical protein